MLHVAVSLEQNWNAVPGGTSVSTNRLIEAMVADGSVRISGFHGSHGEEPRLEIPSGLEPVKLPFPGRVLQQSWSRSQWPSIDSHVLSDVVHAPAYVMPATSRPVVVTIHDLAFLRHPEWFTRNGVRFLRRFVEVARSRARAVIVPSEVTAQDCIEAGFETDLIQVIPWGIDVETPVPASIQEAQRRHGVTPGGVMFVGTQEPRKNLETLVKAMEDLPDVPFTVVGPHGWGELDLGRAQRTGYVDQADVAALMAGADIVAYPSHFEGFGLPVLEAMAVGTATVVSASTASHEVGGEACVGVDTSSPQRLREAIVELLADGARRDELVRRGIERAANFRWDHAATRTIEVYRSLVA